MKLLSKLFWNKWHVIQFTTDENGFKLNSIQIIKERTNKLTGEYQKVNIFKRFKI